MEAEDIIKYVFGEEFQILSELQKTDSPLSKKPFYLKEIPHHIEKTLNNLTEPVSSQSDIDKTSDGCIGPRLTCFDIDSHVGLLILDADRLTVNSQTNFSTILANTCVYKGKWQYEVQLGSKGVMQIGWATNRCNFSQEIGVGDTKDSYSYDGNRVRKWNITTHKYGNTWLSGDVIGCLINLDEGKIEFCRNGESLGEAFSNVHIGPGMAYFPAVSLALNESLVANFGSIPFRYPVVGYKSMQEPPKSDVTKGRLFLFSWMSQLLVLIEHNQERMDSSVMIPPEAGSMSDHAFLMSIARTLFNYLAPALQSSYVVVSCLIPFLEGLTDLDMFKFFGSDTIMVTKLTRLNIFLDIMWAFLEESQMQDVLQQILIYLLGIYRTVSVTLDYPQQKQSLLLLTHIVEHPYTRYYLLENFFFDKLKFTNFIYVKPVDDAVLSRIVTQNWWHSDEPDPEKEILKMPYVAACHMIKENVEVLENMQVKFLKLFLIDDDGSPSRPSSRKVFLRKFRKLVMQPIVPQVAFPETTPQVALCCFYSLMTTFRILWEEELHYQPIVIPSQCFFDGTINYSGIDRFGGILSHLHKTLKADLIRVLGEDHKVIQSINAAAANQSSESLDENGLALLISGQLPTEAVAVENRGRRYASVPMMMPFHMLIPAAQLPGFEFLHTAVNPSPSAISAGFADSPLCLLDLLDSLILLYHTAAHKHMIQINRLRESMAEYDKGLRLLKTSLDANTNITTVEEVSEAIRIIEEKLNEQCKHMAWALAATLSDEKQSTLLWLLEIVVHSLRAFTPENQLLSFVPYYYLEALVELNSGVRTCQLQSVLETDDKGYHNILIEIADFLCQHFNDPRIVLAQSKDTLTHALAKFVCHKHTLTALESVPCASRLKLVHSLMKPYENRAWAQNNWILSRMWQGCGFAFRYKKSPHLVGQIGPKVFQSETSLIYQTMNPCPSLIYQFHVRDILNSDASLCTAFLNSVLNQLNWAFSEFISMLQEIKNLSDQLDRVLIDSRHLRICATCFDLTVALLRVLEMIATVAGEVFKDFTKPMADSLLARLWQLICQVLNRVSTQSGCFQIIMDINIPDLEMVHHFPILAAIVGVMLALLGEEMQEFNSRRCALPVIPYVSKVLITEPSFQIKSLYILIQGISNPSEAMASKEFSFSKYPQEVNSEEIDRLKIMVSMLDTYWKTYCDTKVPEDEENLCSICYAYPISATFKPCNHQSCRSCIAHYLMNCKICFFCKASIKLVIGPDGTILHQVDEESSTAQTM